MNSMVIIERKEEKNNTFIINIEDIKHIKNDIELSLEALINKLESSIEKHAFDEGMEYLKLSKKVYKKNPKINSLGFILEGKDLICQYNKNADSYNLLILEERLSSLINSVSYLDEIENSELYKNTFYQVRDLRNKLLEMNIIKKLDEAFKNSKNNNEKEIEKFIKEIFKDKYEDNFYNSAEFTYNIIENNIYKNIEDFNELQKVLDKIYLLYKFNLEKDINKKVEILYDMSINGFMNIEYVYKDYVVRALEKKNYKTIDELREDILKLGNKIKSFDKKSMPI